MSKFSGKGGMELSGKQAHAVVAAAVEARGNTFVIIVKRRGGTAVFVDKGVVTVERIHRREMMY
jgi:hypothetical protein